MLAICFLLSTFLATGLEKKEKRPTLDPDDFMLPGEVPWSLLHCGGNRDGRSWE